MKQQYNFMRAGSYIPMFLTFMLLVAGCKKDTSIITSVASITVINAMPDANDLYMDFNGPAPRDRYISLKKLTYKSYAFTNSFSRPAGEQPLAWYRAVDTLSPASPIVTMTLPLSADHIYTLFLTGTSANPDKVLTDDVIPYHSVADSVTGIRFINLSPGSKPITVNIKGMSTGGEVESLPYKSITSFKFYPAHSRINDYTFEFRDKESGQLLTTYTTGKMNDYYSSAMITVVNKWLFRNSTIIFLGLPEGQGAQAQAAALLNHF